MVIDTPAAGQVSPRLLIASALRLDHFEQSSNLVDLVLTVRIEANLDFHVDALYSGLLLVLPFAAEHLISWTNLILQPLQDLPPIPAGLVPQATGQAFGTA
jgi:hypothetical protein